MSHGHNGTWQEYAPRIATAAARLAGWHVTVAAIDNMWLRKVFSDILAADDLESVEAAITAGLPAFHGLHIRPFALVLALPSGAFRRDFGVAA